MEWANHQMDRARAERREYRATLSHPEGWRLSDAHLAHLRRTLAAWGGLLTGHWQIPGTPPYLEVWFVLSTVEAPVALQSCLLRTWSDCLAGGEGEVEVSFRCP